MTPCRRHIDKYPLWSWQWSWNHMRGELSLSRGRGDVPAWKRPGYPAGDKSATESGRTGVYSSRRHHQQVPIPGPIGGWHYSKNERQTRFLAPFAASTAIQLGTVGPQATISSGATAAQAEEILGDTGSGVRRTTTAAGEMLG